MATKKNKQEVSNLFEKIMKASVKNNPKPKPQNKEVSKKTKKKK